MDVFSGCGGLSLGLLSAGWQGIFAIEKNQDAFSTLEHNLVAPEATKIRFEWPEWLNQEAMEVSDLLANHREEISEHRVVIDLIKTHAEVLEKLEKELYAGKEKGENFDEAACSSGESRNACCATRPMWEELDEIRSPVTFGTGIDTHVFAC